MFQTLTIALARLKADNTSETLNQANHIYFLYSEKEITKKTI